MSRINEKERTYKLNHEALPYNIELSLPLNVIDSIYSFLRPRYSQTPLRIKMERHQIELNHKITRLNELLELRRKRRIEKEKKRQDLIQHLDKIIASLEKLL